MSRDTTVEAMSVDIASHVRDLDDLGLALLLSLTANQHCIIRTDKSQLDATSRRLQQICLTAFSLSCVVVDCSNDLSQDEFREGVLCEATNNDDDAITVNHGSHRETSAKSAISLDDRTVASVVVAQNLDIARADVKTQTIELLRSGRIFTRMAMHRTPKTFLFVALNANPSESHLNKHLNDMFGICHVHERSPHEAGACRKGSFDSIRSYSSASRSLIAGPRSLTEPDFHVLRSSLDQVRMTAEVETYMRNLVVAARMHKYVAGGISAAATMQLGTLSRAFSVLHGIDYVPPALVDMAFRKTYLHRVVLADRNTARSLQWGSQPDAVEKDMAGITAEAALNAVIASVDTPL